MQHKKLNNAKLSSSSMWQTLYLFSPFVFGPTWQKSNGWNVISASAHRVLLILAAGLMKHNPAANI